LTKEGIPRENIDAEFILKSLKEKMDQSPLLTDFYTRCVENHLAVADHPDSFLPMDQMLLNDNIRQDLIQLVGKPSVLLSEKIKSLKTKSGKQVGFELCFLPVGNLGGANYSNEPYRLFWQDVCQKGGVSFMDMTEPMNALKSSFYPTAEHGGIFHFDYNGHTFLGAVFAHELIHQKLIPFESQVSK
jgi:hypothetical protein